MERKWWTLLIVCVATFMLLLDVTVVNVALPDIQKDLHSSFSDLQWVVDAYSLMLAALLLTAGSLADLLGRRKVFAAGLVVFSLGSLLCGLAGSPTVLNVSRGVQGIGGAIMFATSLALLAQEFHGKDRGTAFGVWGATTGFAVAVGPLVGGAIVEGIGWEWIFFVNVPIGILALIGTLTRLSESRDESQAGVDWPGVVTFSGALFCLVYALIKGNDKGWTSGLILGLLIASAVLLGLFILAEARGKRPMFDLTLFRKPTFGGASLVAFCLSGGLFAMFLYFTLYMQNVLGYSPLESGLRFLPLSILSFLVAPVAGRLSAHMPVRAFMAGGLLLVTAGLLLMHGVTDGDGWTVLLPGFLLGGAGVGLINPPLASTAIGVVPPQRSGMASGINSTFRQVGIATGIAGLGAIFQHSVTASLADKTPLTGDALDRASQGVQAGAVQIYNSPRLGPIARDAFINGFNHIILVAAGISLVGAIGALVLIRQKDFVGAPSHAGDAEAAPAGA